MTEADSDVQQRRIRRKKSFVKGPVSDAGNVTSRDSLPDSSRHVTEAQDSSQLCRQAALAQEYPA